MKNNVPFSWRKQILSSITKAKDLNNFLPGEQKDIETLLSHYPMRITPYFFSLIKSSTDAIARQVIPNMQELTDDLPHEDPLHENRQSPVKGLIHRYPDRVLFLVSNQCAVYCRYCMRKRMTGQASRVDDVTRKAGMQYIAQTSSVKEVILSGGDPLLLETDTLNHILKTLYEIRHVEIIRVHTRAPGVLPCRITDRLVAMLKQYPPLFINIQFNHPDEITEDVKTACNKLADAGISLGSQTVLLKGINDHPETMIALMRKLLTVRIKPYYLHHPDVIKGTGHFRTHIDRGLKIMAYLRGRISGMGIPQYMIDLPGGGGKVALLPETIKGKENGNLKVAGLNGQEFTYPEGEK